MTPVQNNLRRNCNIACSIINLCIAVLAVGLVCIAAVLGLYGLFYGREVPERLRETLQNITYVYPNDSDTRCLFMICLILTVVRQGLLLAGFVLMGRILRGIGGDGLPFERKYVRRIYTVGWLTAATSLAEGTIQHLERAVMGQATGGWAGVSLTWLAFSAFVFCLAFIFDYGCQLQKESDETL